MGIGEAPMNPCGVKVINDCSTSKSADARWASSTQLLPLGCRKPTDSGGDDAGDGLARDFITIGVLGIFLAIGWYMLYRTAST